MEITLLVAIATASAVLLPSVYIYNLKRGKTTANRTRDNNYLSDSAMWAIPQDKLPRQEYSPGKLAQKTGLEEKTLWGLYPLGYQLLLAPSYKDKDIEAILNSQNRLVRKSGMNYLRNWEPEPIYQSWIYNISDSAAPLDQEIKSSDQHNENRYIIEVYKDFLNPQLTSRIVSIVIQTPNSNNTFTPNSVVFTRPKGYAFWGDTIWNRRVSNNEELIEVVLEADGLLQTPSQIDILAALLKR